MRDYSARYSGGIKMKQRVSGRSPRRPRGSVLKIMGIIVTIAMLVGIGVCLWFGWAVRTSLDGLAGETGAQRELITLNRSLRTQRDALLEKDRIKATAGKLGLFPPGRNQVRRP